MRPFCLQKFTKAPPGFFGGPRRTNLEFVVVPTTDGEKFPYIHQILLADLPPETPGGAIVYCATWTARNGWTELGLICQPCIAKVPAEMDPGSKKLLP